MDTQPQPDKITAAEIRELFAETQGEIETLTNRLEQAIEKMTSAVNIINDARRQVEIIRQSSQPAPQVGATETMQAKRMIRSRANGKWYYKMQGGRYHQRGVTVWDEVLKDIGIDPKEIAWDDQDGYTFPTPINVVMALKEYTDDAGIVKITPQKITGRA